MRIASISATGLMAGIHPGVQVGPSHFHADRTNPPQFDAEGLIVKASLHGGKFCKESPGDEEVIGLFILAQSCIRARSEQNVKFPETSSKKGSYHFFRLKDEGKIFAVVFEDGQKAVVTYEDGKVYLKNHRQHACFDPQAAALAA